MKNIVIIGGAFEGFALAQALPGARVVLPGTDRVARDWARPVTLGLTPDALRGASHVIDATHPCDSGSAFEVARLCAAAGIARVQLVRPAWRAARRDHWVRLRHPKEAAAAIPQGARVLVATGRWALPHLRALSAHLLVRRRGAAGPFPLVRGRYLTGSGPFTLAEEIQFLRKNRVDWLLVHNAGGPGGWPKLEAARRLGLPVAMLDRPRRPPGRRVDTVEGALAWLN